MCLALKAVAVLLWGVAEAVVEAGLAFRLELLGGGCLALLLADVGVLGGAEPMVAVGLVGAGEVTSLGDVLDGLIGLVLGPGDTAEEGVELGETGVGGVLLVFKKCR